jgi:hypothetical protein
MNIAAIGLGEQQQGGGAAGEDEGVLAATREKLSDGVKDFARKVREKVHHHMHGGDSSSSNGGGGGSKGGIQTSGGHGDIAAGGLCEMPAVASAGSGTSSAFDSTSTVSVADAASGVGSSAASGTQTRSSSTTSKRDGPMDMSAVEERHIISLNVRRLSLPSPTHLTPNLAMMAGATHLPVLEESPSVSLTVSDVED